jgi:hypothetical protein
MQSQVPIKVVASRLGHADPAMTLKVYQHVTEEAAQLAVQALDRALSSPSTDADEPTHSQQRHNRDCGLGSGLSARNGTKQDQAPPNNSLISGGEGGIRILSLFLCNFKALDIVWRVIILKALPNCAGRPAIAPESSSGLQRLAEGAYMWGVKAQARQALRRAHPIQMGSPEGRYSVRGCLPPLLGRA